MRWLVPIVLAVLLPFAWSNATSGRPLSVVLFAAHGFALGLTVAFRLAERAKEKP